MTSYKKVIDRFYRRIEKDKSFFLYAGRSPDESMQLARERAMGLLDEACDEIIMTCYPQVDFDDRDDAMAMFNFDLTSGEILLISTLMYRQYIDRDISYLKILSRDYTSTELRVFSPSEARQSFMEMYEAVCAQCARYLDQYRNTDRLTGELREIDFSQYDTAEE